MEPLVEMPDVVVRKNEPMSRHTTYRIGGPVDLWIEVETLESLTKVIGALRGTPLKVLGGGSNLLVSDSGVEGAVIRLKGFFEEITCNGTVITAGAGAPLARLVHIATEAGIAGFEFLEGIPGTVGGAMANNSGTAREGILERLTEARVLNAVTGEIETLNRNEISFDYRWSSFRHPTLVILSGQFTGSPGDPVETRTRVQRIREYRLRTQPMGMASAGSTFRNPPGEFAGHLIESVGLKGFRIGDAQFSPIHANFIVNLGNARAQDVVSLILLAQKKVFEAYQIQLIPEVERVGRWAGA
ncbi:MAG: UDP-N-acetylmuramate dehydrogenase [bacterium JZ-2024 1]